MDSTLQSLVLTSKLQQQTIMGLPNPFALPNFAALVMHALISINPDEGTSLPLILGLFDCASSLSLSTQKLGEWEGVGRWELLGFTIERG